MKYNIVEVERPKDDADLNSKVSSISTEETKSRVQVIVKLENSAEKKFEVPKVIGSTITYAEKVLDGLWVTSGLHGLIQVAVTLHFCPTSSSKERESLASALSKFKGIEFGVLLLLTDYLYNKNGAISSSALSMLKDVYDSSSYQSVNLSASTVWWPNVTITDYAQLKQSFVDALSGVIAVSNTTTISTSDISVKNFCANAVFFYKPLAKLLGFSAMPEQLSSTIVVDSLYALLRPDLMAPALIRSLGVVNADNTSDIATPDTVGEMIRTLLGKNITDKIGWVLDTDVEFKKVGSVEKPVYNLFSEMMSGTTEIKNGKLLINNVEMISSEFSGIPDQVIITAEESKNLLKAILMILSLSNDCVHNVEQAIVTNVCGNPRLLRVLDKRAEL